MMPKLNGPLTKYGLAIAGITLVLDQLTKLWILNVVDLDSIGRVPVLPFLDLAMAWNQGISYGLFQQDTAFGRAALVLLAVAATALLAVWLAGERLRVNAAALGLIMGGAVGNAIDRAVYGAVADFVLLHWGAFTWYVFNVADIAIVVGVALLLYGAFRGGDRSQARDEPAGTMSAQPPHAGEARDGT